LRPPEPAEREKVPAIRNSLPVRLRRAGASGAGAADARRRKCAIAQDSSIDTVFLCGLHFSLMMIALLSALAFCRAAVFKGVSPEHFPSAPV